MTLRTPMRTLSKAVVTSTLVAVGAAVLPAAGPAPAASAAYAVGAHMRPAVTAYTFLGTPLEAETVAATGWWSQRFTGGWGYTTGTTSRYVPASYAPIYTYVGTHRGALGIPAANPTRVPGGTLQMFARGRIYQETGKQAFAVYGPMHTAYVAAGAHATLGLPLSRIIDVGSYRFQIFQRGSIYMGPSGTSVVKGKIDVAYRNQRGPYGWLGWPKGGTTHVAGADTHAFAGGRIYGSSASSATMTLTNAKMGGVTPPTGPAAFAVGQIGDAYRYGGRGPSAWDCSGLVSGSFGFSGAYVSPATSTMRSTAAVVPSRSLRPGDILWWSGHAGIYLGTRNGVPVMIHALNPRKGIQTTPVSWITAQQGSYTVLRKSVA